MGEMTTARLHGVDVVCVKFPEFEWPSVNSIAHIGHHVEGIESLVRYGISLELVQATLRWLPGLPQIVMPQDITLACVDAVVEKLVVRRGGKCEAASVPGIVSEKTQTASDSVGDVFWKHRVQLLDDTASPAGCRVVAVVDHSNSEVLCTAHVITELLKVHCPRMTKVSHVLGRGEHVSEDVRIVLVICSTSCFHQTSFVRQLVEAAARGVQILAITAENFKAPKDWHTEMVFEAIAPDSSEIPSHDQSHQTRDLPCIMQTVFEASAVGVHPQEAEGVLELRARTIARRLTEGTLATLSPPRSRPTSSERKREISCGQGSGSPRPALLLLTDETVTSPDDVMPEIREHTWLQQEVHESDLLSEHKSPTTLSL